MIKEDFNHRVNMDKTMVLHKAMINMATHITISTGHHKDIMDSLACNINNRCHPRAIMWIIVALEEQVKDVAPPFWVPWLAAAVLSCCSR